MKEELVNCNKCGVLFKKTLRNICNKCLEIEHSNMEKINNYAERNPLDMFSVESLSKAVNIEVSDIQELLRNGKLANLKHRIMTNCKACGCEITNINGKGNFCNKCSNKSQSDNIETVTHVDLRNIKISLKTFDKNIMHTKKELDSNQKFKYGLKKNSH